MNEKNNIFGLDLKVDQDYIAEAVKQSVLMGISESLNGKNEIVSQIVSMTLNTKVDNKGEISTYSSNNKYTLLEYYVRKMITEVTADEMNKLVEEHREDITKAIRSELTKKVNYNKFVDAFINNVASAVNSSWCPQIKVSFDQKKDYDY